MSFNEEVESACQDIAQMLIGKNAAYGNSALDPVRIFSKADTVEQLKVRIDDKLSRIQRGSLSDDEDTLLDLIGYLILLRIALARTVGRPGRVTSCDTSKTPELLLDREDPKRTTSPKKLGPR